MPFGALAPLPIRLGGSPTEGWAARQHARAAAELVMLWRTLPLALVTFERSTAYPDGAVVRYNGRNGVGPLHAPTLTQTDSPDGFLWELEWARSYEDAFGVQQRWTLRHANTTGHFLLPGFANTFDSQVVPGTTGKVSFKLGTNATPWRATCVVYGSWGDDRQIGTYGGEPDKRDNTTEADEPYAAQWLREIQAMRGSAYTKDRGSLVDVENVALARHFAAVWSRTPEKFRANATPRRADERLEYWRKVLGVARRATDPDWKLRQNCSAHYQAAQGPRLDVIESSLRTLLGEAFVALHTQTGNDLDAPPTLTFWPIINPGPAAYDIGGGCWSSERSHLTVEVRQPSGMSNSDFSNLLNVQMFQLLDGLLPAWATFDWTTGDGFLLDISQLDFAGMTT